MSTRSTLKGPSKIIKTSLIRRAVWFGVLIMIALFAFEVFNFGTTEFALSDLIGDLRFLNIRWATILAIAFCGIDFAGLARLFTPEQGHDEPTEVRFMLGAWLLAAGMNALLTWWGISVAIANHQSMGSSVINHAVLLKIVPIFVAIMVWLTRVLIIGTFSMAGDRLFGTTGKTRSAYSHSARANTQAAKPAVKPLSFNRQATTTPNNTYRPSPKPEPQIEPESTYSRPEPTYHPVSAAPRNSQIQSRSAPSVNSRQSVGQSHNQSVQR